MKRGLILGIVIFSLFLTASFFVVAKSDSDNSPDLENIIPAHAVEISNGIFSLGQALDPQSKRLVQGYMFIEDRRENAKPDGVGGGNGGGKGKPGSETKSTCYSLMAKGTKWKTAEPYITGAGVDFNLMDLSLDTWDTESSQNIFGLGSSGTTDGADSASPDGKNEVELQNLGPTNTIAYTVVWGFFSGSPRQRELIEWDMVFNTAYPFGDAETSNPSVMDFQNIATHEAGHALGLTHPEDTCNEETMYAYADLNEVKKRTLESGDRTGLGKLY